MFGTFITICALSLMSLSFCIFFPLYLRKTFLHIAPLFKTTPFQGSNMSNISTLYLNIESINKKILRMCVFTLKFYTTYVQLKK